ncbi:sulfotransferase family protein [Membranihabitans maritimus]|uniref:sulfotransferase family protein n=1 Tax=Membranihabitans maritimus TaxID=2904244 RepID=UPI001F344D0A|nr:sulfotransferase [Membranihabitans maritimus]
MNEPKNCNLLFLIGISPRSGTNFLYRQLILHPDINQSNIKGEDRTINHSNLLINYATTVGKNQPSRWGNSTKDLEKNLGNALREYFLSSVKKSKYAILKTPLTDGIINIPVLFEDYKIIFLVRDGRNIIESYSRSFDTSFMGTLVRVTQHAKKMQLFLESVSNDKFHVVKYENLLTNFNSEITDLLKFLDLPVENYPFDQAKNMGVIGSSTFTGNSTSPTWKKEVEKNDTFTPNSRSKDWPKYKHILFNYYAGHLFKKWGYILQYSPRNITYFFVSISGFILYHFHRIRLNGKTIIQSIQLLLKTLLK